MMPTARPEKSERDGSLFCRLLRTGSLFRADSFTPLFVLRLHDFGSLREVLHEVVRLADIGPEVVQLPRFRVARSDKFPVADLNGTAALAFPRNQFVRFALFAAKNWDKTFAFHRNGLTSTELFSRHFPFGFRLEPIQARNVSYSNNLRLPRV